MRTTIIKNSWVAESIQRLDASYHLSSGVSAKRTINKLNPYPTTTLGAESSELFKGNIHKRVYVTSPEHGLMFYTASDLYKSSIDSGKYVSKKYSPYLSELELNKDWILITRSGTLGKVVCTNRDHEGRIATDDLIRIKPSEKSIKRGCLYAFLASKYGYGLLTQSGYGGVVKHIEPHQIKDISVPVFPPAMQEEVHNLIMDSVELRVDGNKLLNDANNLLFTGIGLENELISELTKPREKDIRNSFTISSSKISSLTLRGRNYSPRKQKIIEVLKAGNFNNLRDVLSEEPFYGGRYKRVESYSKNSLELLSQGDIFDLKPKGRQISIKSINNPESEIILKETILVPGQGTLGENEIFGRAKFAWGYLENKLVAGHAMRFIPDTKKVPSGYLYAVLNSPLWFRLFRNTVYGTNLLGFIVPLINELPIPRLDNYQELEIDEKVKRAYEKLTLSNEKEDQAIELIEKEMESWQG